MALLLQQNQQTPKEYLKSVDLIVNLLESSSTMVNDDDQLASLIELTFEQKEEVESQKQGKLPVAYYCIKPFTFT